MSKTQLAGIPVRALDASTGGRVARSIMAAVMVALAVTWAAPASAQQAKCLAGKTKCMASKAAGLLKCHEADETPGKTADPTCEMKVEDKFNGGGDPTKSCFGKLENKKGSDCSPGDNTTAAENAVDSCVGAFVAVIDPSGNTQSKCLVGKKKCVAKLLGSLLKCQATAQTPGKPTATGDCETKATDKYTGGMDPTKGCFAKLEAKDPTGCAPTGNSGPLLADVTKCVANLVALETATPPGGTVLKGALAPTPGRFNYNGAIGLPGALAACQSTFGASTHVCTLADLQNAQAAGDLVGLRDTTNALVTSFWAIDSSEPALRQCNDDAQVTGSGLNWEYGTAHTPSRGDKIPLDNAHGMLGALQPSEQCALLGTPATVACCQ
jgi:hypothetical protein